MKISSYDMCKVSVIIDGYINFFQFKEVRCGEIHIQRLIVTSVSSEVRASGSGYGKLRHVGARSTWNTSG